MGVKEYKGLIGYDVVEGYRYICFVGRSLTICDKKLNLVCRFSDMKNYGWADFISDNLLVACNTGSTYKVYDIAQQKCLQTYTAHKRGYTSYEQPLLDREKRVVYNSCHTNTHDKREFTVLDLDAGAFRYIDFPYQMVPGGARRLDQDGNFSCACRELVPEGEKRRGIAKILTLKDDRFEFREFQPPLYSHIDCYTEDFLVTSKSELIWLNNEKRVQLNLPEQHRGYLKTNAYAYLKESRQLFLAYSECVCGFDLATNTCAFFYPEKYISDVQVIGNDLFIGTWEKTIVLPLEF